MLDLAADRSSGVATSWSLWPQGMRRERGSISTSGCQNLRSGFIGAPTLGIILQSFALPVAVGFAAWMPRCQHAGTCTTFAICFHLFVDGSGLACETSRVVRAEKRQAREWSSEVSQSCGKQNMLKTWGERGTVSPSAFNTPFIKALLTTGVASRRLGLGARQPRWICSDR